MLFENHLRINRTDTVPSGRSAGRGMPDICLGSGIWNCALRLLPPKRPRTQRVSPRILRVVMPSAVICILCVHNFCPQLLQNRASASFAVAHAAQWAQPWDRR